MEINFRLTKKKKKEYLWKLVYMLGLEYPQGSSFLAVNLSSSKNPNLKQERTVFVEQKKESRIKRTKEGSIFRLLC